MSFLYLPFVLQGISMVFDEFYFHRKRGLPKWEVIGHPLDTLTVLAVYIFLIVQDYSLLNLQIALGLTLFSSLFITKDEFVHSEKCEPQENWLHAVLFVLHPMSLGSAIYIWYAQIDPLFLRVQAFVVAAFLIYQILYWSYFAKSK